jgi:DNA (cytosine-5)-methyltransferase 1
VILIGVKKGSDHNLESIYRAIRQLTVKTASKTVRDAIGDLPVFTPVDTPYKENGRNISHVPFSKGFEDIHHTPRYHNPRDVTIFRDWVVKDMNKKSMEEKINFYNTLLNKRSNHAKYRNLEWDKPSPTIVAHLYKDGLMFIHPDKNQARSLTVREAALLQSFPENYEFIGSQGYCYKMIGNAVPPQMACTIAKGISSVLEQQAVS